MTKTEIKKLIYLFGSIVTETFREESDVDCAILTDEKAFYQVFPETKTAIEVKINRDVDLIDLKSVDPGFAAEIITTGQLIYSESEQTTGFYTMKVLSAYLQLEEDRKIVVDTIYKRGSVYGTSDTLENRIN